MRSEDRATPWRQAAAAPALRFLAAAVLLAGVVIVSGQASTDLAAMLRGLSRSGHADPAGGRDAAVSRLKLVFRSGFDD